jgi:hypothetical protein
MIFQSCEKEPSHLEIIKQFRPEAESFKSDNRKEFFFVGKTGRKAGIYKYDLNKNDFGIYWASENGTIVKFSYSDNLEYAFFLTARKLGIRRGVSYIRGIKLYRLDLETKSVELISEIGDAVQLFAEWVEKNYRIQFTRFDLKVASHLNKYNQIYSPFGKLIKEELEIYDFIKEGFPQFEIQRKALISPSGNFGIKQSADSIFLYSSRGVRKVIMDSAWSTVSKVKWSNDESYVFFKTNFTNDDNKTHSTIYIYDIVDQLLVRNWSGEEINNFTVANDLLIFDSGFAGNSSIFIYNFRKNEDVNDIRIRGGCGLIYIQGI